MTLATQRLTLEEFLQRPETKPGSEFIHGQIVQKPMPQGKHSTLQLRLADWINDVGLPTQVAYAFPELRCTFSERSIVPDIAVFRWDHIPFDGNGEVANTFASPPDWTIEILSPEQSQTQVTDDILLCLRQGSQMGWLIDPAEKAVICFQPGQLPEVYHRSAEPLPVPEFLMLSPVTRPLTSVTLFGWLKLPPIESI
jgi:Uma2 family endonuclease